MDHATQGAVLLAAVLESPTDDVTRFAYADWLLDDGQEQRAAAVRHGVIKRLFPPRGSVLTLNPHDLGTHADGWTITGDVREDYYEWVNDFEASHPEHGLVWGDFEGVVFASSEEGFRHFYDHHPPHA